VRSLAIAITLSIAAVAGSARAQSASEASLARSTFQEGVEAARAERWQEAVDLFQHSYELSPRPITMINLAGALSQVGRLVEAAEAYRSFLAVARSGSAARLRDEAQAQLTALEGRIPRVRIRVLGLAEDDVVRLDEYDTSPAALDLPLPVDPGAHTITVVRAGHERSIPFTATEGVPQEVVLDARPEAWPGSGTIGTVDPNAITTPPPGRSIVEEPAFWIVIGAVVVVGAGVAIGVGVGTQGPGPIYQGNVSIMGVPL
jgi:hypothetical protein